MKFPHMILGSLMLASLGSGCGHPARKLDQIHLGMAPNDVRTKLGAPYSVRAAKVFENEETTMVWEYWPPFLSLNDQKIHVVFENDKVVQWGNPGDYGTGSISSIKEYKESKK